MADIKMLLKEEPNKIYRTQEIQLYRPTAQTWKLQESRGCNSYSHVASSAKSAKVKSPLMWRLPTRAHLQACSCIRSSIPLLNKTVRIRKLWLFRCPEQAHKTPYQKLASPFTNRLFIQSPSKVRAAPEPWRMEVFPTTTLVNAACDMKNSPLDGNRIQQLTKTLTPVLESKVQKPKVHISSFLKVVHNLFAPQVELWSLQAMDLIHTRYTAIKEQDLLSNFKVNLLSVTHKKN